MRSGVLLASSYKGDERRSIIIDRFYLVKSTTYQLGIETLSLLP